MKKLLLVATLGVAGLMSAKGTEIKEIKEVKTIKKTEKAFYHPIKVTSSCGYTEYIELGGSNISCIEVEMDRMEMECDAPITGWGYA